VEQGGGACAAQEGLASPLPGTLASPLPGTLASPLRRPGWQYISLKGFLSHNAKIKPINLSLRISLDCLANFLKTYWPLVVHPLNFRFLVEPENKCTGYHEYTDHQLALLYVFWARQE